MFSSTVSSRIDVTFFCGIIVRILSQLLLKYLELHNFVPFKKFVFSLCFFLLGHLSQNNCLKVKIASCLASFNFCNQKIIIETLPQIYFNL